MAFLGYLRKHQRVDLDINDSIMHTLRCALQCCKHMAMTLPVTCLSQRALGMNKTEQNGHKRETKKEM